MDATPSNALSINDADVYSDLLVKSEIPEFPCPLQQKNTVIKYTKLPEFDLDSKGLWPRQSYTAQPRTRRFITFQEPTTITTKTMSSEVDLPTKKTASNLTNRKIVTIIEDDEHDVKPRFSKVSRVSSVQKVSKATTAKLNTPKFDINDNISALRKHTRYSNILSKYSRVSKPIAKFNNTYEANDAKSKYNNRRKPTNISTENNKQKTVRGKDILSSKSARSNIYKTTVPQTKSEREVSLIKSQLNDNETVKKPLITTVKKPIINTVKKPKKKVNTSKLTKPDSRNPVLSPKDFSYKTTNVIHVPLEDVYKKKISPPSSYVTTPQCLSTTELIVQKDQNISTDSPKLKVNSNITMEPEPRIIYKYLQSTDVQTELIKETFDSLDIPNVTLTKTESDGESRSKSLTNIPLSAFRSAEEVSTDSNLVSTSFIISRATLTYTTKQKFDLQVVGSNDDAYSNQTPNPLSYPINVVSVYKKEMQNEDSETKIAQAIDNNRKNSKCYKNRISNLKTLDCSYEPNGNQLMKPSDIISTIKVNNGIMQSDYICEQFQRELNFIDSFFESLIYLESTLAKKYVAGDKIDKVVTRRDLAENTNSFGYENFLSNFRTDSIDDDNETMASKNLFLLNILIRDEQRRAKNLLFVLKRREDALKNFTKSQILYLENKKKQDNTDISALKKKQRGALLKLQHECGEMQRMRRALLTLSDKRKQTLMKTKKDLELKLKNNVDVDKIILGKKIVKRNASADRTSPLKCFDLSSSGCEDSSTSRRHSMEQISPEHIAKRVESAEKSIQTGDSTYIEESTNTVDENFIIVDGGYLNILFHNLSLPQIFSGGKQYEVNEPALKNIVDSCNSRQDLNNRETVQVHALIDNLKNRESDASTPSTARSLLDEFDQYYKVLQNKYDSVSSEESDFKISVCELKDAVVQAECSEIFEPQTASKSTLMNTEDDDVIDKVTINTEEDIIIDEPCECEVIAKESMESINVVEPCEGFENAEDKEDCLISPAGPLPVPVGESTTDGSTDPPTWHPVNASATTSTSYTFSDDSIPDSLDEQDHSVTLSEAEELRKQQLAIEKEIKELEQQQCMVVREIPDKPPPPYTAPAPPRQFKLDDVTTTTVNMLMNMNMEDYTEPKEAFDAFVQDFCSEALERTRQEQSDVPWAACNLTPPKPPLNREKLAEETVVDLNQVLAGAKPTVISGISTRRSDHIDDVLFTEWQRVEPEWTSLHKDEAVIKNLVFESIFQRILTDTVDEYKRTVLNDDTAND